MRSGKDERAGADPFRALGLPARAGLTDDDVRAAWRRIAAAAHPDRDDGGDPVRFAAGAAAYAALRTSYGRGEALADLRAPAAGALSAAVRLTARRRPLALASRLLGAAAVCAGSFLAAGWSPGTIGVFAGALTWFAVTCFGASRS